MSKHSMFNLFGPVVGGGVAQSNQELYDEVFADGVGAVYDPSNHLSMFQEYQGVTPANLAGHAVGLKLDVKHGLATGPELSAYVNGFASLVGIAGVGVTLALSGTDLVITSTSADGADRAEIPIAGLEVGEFYDVQVVALQGAQGTQQRIGSSTALNQITFAVNDPAAVNYRCRVAATAVSGVIRTYSQQAVGAVGDSMTVRTISVRKIYGEHATQQTPGSRSILARRPANGVRNQLTYTEDLTNAAWTKTGATVDVSGLITSTGANVQVSQALAVKTAQDHVVTWKVKAGTSNIAVIYMLNYDGVFRAWFNLASGSVGSRLGFTDSTITGPDADGFYTCTATGFSSITDLIGSVAIGMSDADGTITATVGRTLTAKCAQFEPGAVATPYQRVESIYDVSEAGQPDRWCLMTDGIDDWMVTQTITPPAFADKAQVVCGVKKRSDAAPGVIAELGPSVNTANGSFALYAPSAVRPDYGFVSRGTALSAALTLTGYTSPVDSVLTGFGDISNDVSTLRIDGVEVVSSSTNQGSGPYAVLPLYLYRRSDATAPAKVEDYYMVVRIAPTNLSFTQIEKLEAIAAARMPAA